MVVNPKFNKSKKEKEMKKIFYILTAAVVALGAMACENEGLENVAPENNNTVVIGDGLAITANVSRVEWSGLTPAWEKDDSFVIDGFKFVHQGDANNTFLCTEEGVRENFDYGTYDITFGTLDSSAGLEGTVFTAKGVEVKLEGTVANFAPANALLMFTTKGSFKDPFVLTAGEGLFSEGTTWSVQAEGEYYVAVNAGATVTLNYSIGGVTQKEKSITTTAGTIYNLGELTATTTTYGLCGLHQGWDTANTDALYLIPGTNTYARKGVTLAKNDTEAGFKFYSPNITNMMADVSSYILLKPNSNWTQASAWFAVYTWDPAKWIKMTKAAGTSGYYYVNKSDCNSNIIFCRQNPAFDVAGWDDNGNDYNWNQTNDLTKPSTTNNAYTIASGAWSNGSGSWSTVSTLNVGSATDQWIGLDKTTDVATTWYQRWSNNKGSNNITVADYTKEYDIYFHQQDPQIWGGFEIYFTVVESGTEVTLK